MTYNVFTGTLNLTLSFSLSFWDSLQRTSTLKRRMVDIMVDSENYTNNPPNLGSGARHAGQHSRIRAFHQYEADDLEQHNGSALKQGAPLNDRHSTCPMGHYAATSAKLSSCQVVATFFIYSITRVTHQCQSFGYFSTYSYFFN